MIKETDFSKNFSGYACNFSRATNKVSVKNFPFMNFKDVPLAASDLADFREGFPESKNEGSIFRGEALPSLVKRESPSGVPSPPMSGEKSSGEKSPPPMRGENRVGKNPLPQFPKPITQNPKTPYRKG
jgi:hypothetical protein